MPQLDRPPLPSYEELFLTPPKSRANSSFDLASSSGFPASPSIDSSTPRHKTASFGAVSSANSSVNGGGGGSSAAVSRSDVSIHDNKDAFNVTGGDKNNNDDKKIILQSNEVSKDDVPDASVISVRERAKKLNKLQSESELLLPPSRSSSLLNTPELQRTGVRRSVAAGSEAGATLPVHLTRELRKWMVLSATTNYHPIAKMISENKNLVYFKDFVTGYTPLHWAAKAGQVELVKLIAGHGAAVNAKSNGGYTPLHLAFIQSHRETAEILVNVYKADPNIRDHAGKTPTAHNVKLATELGFPIGLPGSTSGALSTPPPTPTVGSGLSRWVGLRSSGSRNETKSTSSSSSSSSMMSTKMTKLERKESKAERKESAKAAEDLKAFREKMEMKRTKPRKSTPNKNSTTTTPVDQNYEKTTQVTFV